MFTGLKLDTELCELSTAKPAAGLCAAATNNCELFRQNMEIDTLGTDQTIAAQEEVLTYAITAARVFLAGPSGQQTSQIDFYAEEPSEEQVVEAEQHARASIYLVTRRKPPKHNYPPTPPMLAFDQVLADLETNLQQQYRLLQGTLTQIIHNDCRHDASADGHGRTRELIEDTTIPNNTARVQQLDAEVVISITPD
ncbi:MAG: hypothetical protein EZS28_048756 [Streblomastix strix]|uniref:Uncharacterized protein n=1 Tax=Streblomastix strix TaxID=222440 RepID=A0A5J4TBV7_9EUKA|nr:MAG: hypothetical protein EZS28_048756 [Streblomastix strix]